jgi:hypothetical protein
LLWSSRPCGATTPSAANRLIPKYANVAGRDYLPQGDGGTNGNCCAHVRTVVMPLPAAADAFVFSTGNHNNLMATATPPASGSNFEIETGDDLVLTQT